MPRGRLGNLEVAVLGSLHSSPALTTTEERSRGFPVGGSGPGHELGRVTSVPGPALMGMNQNWAAYLTPPVVGPGRSWRTEATPYLTSARISSPAA